MMITFPFGNQLQIQKRAYKDQKWVWDTFQGGNEPIHVLGSIDFTHSILKKHEQNAYIREIFSNQFYIGKIKVKFLK